MKIVTLNDEKFKQAAKRLFLEITAAKLRPDIIVGIAKGGAEVVKCLEEYLPEACIYFVKCSRPTSYKKRIISPILRLLPSKINIFLRKLEAYMYKMNTNQNRILETGFDSDFINKSGASKILVVDDAVDSGVTLKTVVNELYKVLPDARVWTAVMTVTTSNPVIRPDIVLYKEPTIIRFPWSADIKKK